MIVLVCDKLWLNSDSAADVRFWIVAVPVFVAFVAILFIVAWIGWTRGSTIFQQLFMFSLLLLNFVPLLFSNNIELASLNL